MIKQSSDNQTFENTLKNVEIFIWQNLSKLNKVDGPKVKHKTSATCNVATWYSYKFYTLYKKYFVIKETSNLFMEHLK